MKSDVGAVHALNTGRAELVISPAEERKRDRRAFALFMEGNLVNTVVQRLMSEGFKTSIRWRELDLRYGASGYDGRLCRTEVECGIRDEFQRRLAKAGKRK